MNNKKLFAEPICEVTRFDVEDIVASSYLTNAWDTDAFAFDTNGQDTQ